MKNTARTWLTTGAVGIAGVVVGGVLAATVSANADDATTETPDATAPGGGYGNPPMGGTMPGADPSRPQRPDEELLQGDTLTKVKEAALAKYPDATVVRVETDSDGVYEAHLTKADGTPVTVEVNKAFEVTGEEQMGPGGPGDHGRFGPPGSGPSTEDGGEPDGGDSA